MRFHELPKKSPASSEPSVTLTEEAVAAAGGGREVGEIMSFLTSADDIALTRAGAITLLRSNATLRFLQSMNCKCCTQGNTSTMGTLRPARHSWRMFAGLSASGLRSGLS